MARRSETGLTDNETVIGSGVKVKGSLVSEGDINIDGEVKGSIKTTGNLVVGVNGLIEANVSARNVRIGGHLIGNIKSENETVIEGTGKVKGNVHTATLAIEHGALFAGQSYMSEIGSPAAEELKNEN